MSHIAQLFRPISARNIGHSHCFRTLSIKSLTTTASLRNDDSKTKKPIQPASSELAKGQEETKTLTKLINKPGDIQPYEMPDEDINIPKEHVFQQIRTVKHENPIYTLEEASKNVPADFFTKSYKYQNLVEQAYNYHHEFRSYDNQYSTVAQFPDWTDFLVVGSGLVGSAAAYYIKKTVQRTCDLVIIDKDPYGSNGSTAICSGLISCQSKCQDIWRMAQLNKELIRNLRRDLMLTEEEFAQIKYRPCTHLVLWSEKEAEEGFAATSAQIKDGCFTEVKLPDELEATWPWLRVVGSGISMGTHGLQDEALIDPIGLRNLYRTLAQAKGAIFIKAEMIDFNTQFNIHTTTISPFSTSSVVVRLDSGELKACALTKVLLACGHSVPYLESRAEMEEEMRDSIQDMHFLQPKLRVCIIFTSLAAPIINFPVITDTDGSMLLRDDYAGSFKYYLTLDECEALFDEDNERYMNLESNDPYVALFHKDKKFENYFNNIVKPKLVKRIPVMEDAEFMMAHSGFETYNTYDGAPVITMHPFLIRPLMVGGFGKRLSTLGVAAGAMMSELLLEEEPETYDVTNFYWDRVLKGRRLEEIQKFIA